MTIQIPIGGMWTSAAPASAVLLAREGREARIAWGGSVSAARIAFGCLVQPEPDDHVLAAEADGTVWIIGVLERPSTAPMQLWAEGNLAITSAAGNLSLSAPETITLDAGAKARFAAPEIDLHAGMGRFVIDEFLQIGRKAHVYVSKIRNVVEVFETFAEHVLTRAKRASRFIEGSDQLRAGDVDHRADATLQMTAKTMLMTADTLVRVDADQIHMG